MCEGQEHGEREGGSNLFLLMLGGVRTGGRVKTIFHIIGSIKKI